MNMKEYCETIHQTKRITGILTNNRHSRKKPGDMYALENVIRSAIIEDQPFELIGLWGGSKEGIPGDDKDRACLQYLEHFQNELRLHYLKINLSLLYCDVHHYFVNDVSRSNIDEYFDTLERMTRLPFLRLSDEFHEMQGVLLNITTMTDTHSRMEASKIFSSTPTRELLVAAARKHSHLIEMNVEAEDVGRVYAEMEIYFLQRLNARGPHRIFFSFSNPEIQEPIAQAAGVPMLYLHPGTGEHSVPWYNG